MLRKILLIVLLISLAVCFGCKKKESTSTTIPTATEIEEQIEESSAEAEKAAAEGMKEIEAMEKEAAEQVPD
ncbi:MAG: hypothetical protein JW806_09185 [Sedimentisphaerales bacterium]|nr:hypothetical protein [Sedimentisphaerales bacterium]